MKLKNHDKKKIKKRIIKLNSLIDNLSTSEAKCLAKLVFNWCLDHLGENIRKKHKPLEIELDYTPDIGYYGEYFFEEDRILIKVYMSHNKTVEDFIATCLHEHQHLLLPEKEYDILYKKYGYKNHPHERKANKISEKFTNICWEDIKYKLHKNI